MISFDDFKKLEIRIAEIISAEEHPDADKLLLLKINIGDEERNVVAGIKAHYNPDELIGKKVTVITNLEPATIRGQESQAMILVASNDDGLCLIVPEKDITPGAIVK